MAWIQLSADKQLAIVSIDRTLSAFELQTLIADLAVARAQMLPTVQFEPPGRREPAPDSLNVSEQDDPYLQAARLRDGRIRLWIRNQGIGWLAFNIPADKACGLRDYLIANTGANPSGSGLFQKQGSDPDTTH